MSRAHVAWFCFCVAVVVVPDVFVVAFGHENWPWTSAPMFAASPVSNDLYEVRFLLEKKDGTTTKMSSKEAAGMSEWHFRRSFLVMAWGGEDRAAAHGYVADDTPEKRAARVRRYVDGMVRFAKQKRRPVFRDAVALRIEVVRTHPERDPPRVLGRYFFADGRFVEGDGDDDGRGR